MNIDNTLMQKYAPTIASALVLILPAVDLLARNPSTVAVIQFAILVASTIATFQLPAPWKQVAEWVGVVATAILPLALTGELTWANWSLVAVAIVKALATHFGVKLRKDDTIDATATPAGQVPIVTSLPADALPASDALVQGDGLNVDQGGTNTPGKADHRA